MRSGEAQKLKWVDVDFQRRIITLNEPEKGSLPRIWNNLTGKLLGMVNALPRKSPYVFGDCTPNSLKATYTKARWRLAFKLQNPRLLEIHFHTLRHGRLRWNTITPKTSYTSKSSWATGKSTTRCSVFSLTKASSTICQTTTSSFAQPKPKKKPLNSEKSVSSPSSSSKAVNSSANENR